MTNCKSCGNFQSRLNRGGLCDTCKNGPRATNGTDSMNAYYDTNILNSAIASHSQQPSLGGSRMLAPQGGPLGNLNTEFQQQQQYQQQPQPQQQRSFTNGSSLRMPTPIRQAAPLTQQSAITPESLNNLMDKPISELTVADIIQINMISNDPIRQQISTMEKDFMKKFQTMEDRINILGKEKSKLEEENTVLRNVVTNMQKSLNKIDSDVRSKNVIITGLPESEIQFGENGETYTTYTR